MQCFSSQLNIVNFISNPKKSLFNIVKWMSSVYRINQWQIILVSIFIVEMYFTGFDLFASDVELAKETL